MSTGSTEEVIVLRGLKEPRGLAGDTHRGLLVLTCLDGIAYSIRLREAAMASGGMEEAPILSNSGPVPAPHWVSRVFRSTTSSRFDGAGLIPASPESVGTIWKEQ